MTAITYMYIYTPIYIYTHIYRECICVCISIYCVCICLYIHLGEPPATMDRSDGLSPEPEPAHGRPYDLAVELGNNYSLQ